MSHGITINVKDPLRDSISQPTPGANSGSGGVDQKFTNLNSAPEQKPAVTINVYQFWSHNSNLPAERQQRADVAALPVVRDESCWSRLFSCCRG